MDMKKIMVIVAALLFSAAAFSQEKNFIDQNYIEVTGNAEMEVVPDEIYIRIVINEKDNKGKVSVEQQEKEMFRSLKNLGLDLDKDMVVQDMASDLQSYFLRKNTVLTAKTYQLKVSDAATLVKVFQTLNGIGISDLNIERTDVSNMKQLRQQIRGEAARAARVNAETLAEALGQQAGKAIYVQDYSYNVRPYANVMLKARSVAMDSAAGVEESAPELQFEKIKIEHSVMVRFRLE